MPTTDSKYIELSDSHSINDDTPIYRYLSLNQFMHIIETKTIPLLQAIKAWDDPQEGALFDKFIQLMAKQESEKDPSYESPVVRSNNYSKHLHGTSWTSLDESDAMWRIYSSSKQGVKIKTTVRKLKETLRNASFPEWWTDAFFTVGKVLYGFNQIDNELMSDFAYMFLHKRQPFQHENEIRGIVHPIDYNKSLPKGNYEEKAIYAPVVDDFIEEVMVDPRAPNWVLEALGAYCIKNDINKCGISDLYQKPGLLIT